MFRFSSLASSCTDVEAASATSRRRNRFNRHLDPHCLNWRWTDKRFPNQYHVDEMCSKRRRRIDIDSIRSVQFAPLQMRWWRSGVGFLPCHSVWRHLSGEVWVELSRVRIFVCGAELAVGCVIALTSCFDVADSAGIAARSLMMPRRLPVHHSPTVVSETGDRDETERFPKQRHHAWSTPCQVQFH